MRISDWRSDECSSDLDGGIVEEGGFSTEASWRGFLDFMRGDAIYGNASPCFTNHPAFVESCLAPENFVRLAEYNRVGLKTPPPSRESYDAAVEWVKNLGHKLDAIFETYDAKIGRASCRERVCQCV